jgi:hypothetical protein
MSQVDMRLVDIALVVLVGSSKTADAATWRTVLKLLFGSTMPN